MPRDHGRFTEGNAGGGVPNADTPKCGAKTRKDAKHPTCTWPRGFKTDHPGTGNCYLHGGTTPTGRKGAAREGARIALEKLAIPIHGDPIVVLEAAIASAFGFLEGARTLLAESHDPAMAELYGQAIDRAAKAAKLGVDAKIDEARLQIERERAQLIVVIFRVGLDAFERTGSRDEAERALIGELRAAMPAGAELN